MANTVQYFFMCIFLYKISKIFFLINWLSSWGWAAYKRNMVQHISFLSTQTQTWTDFHNTWVNMGCDRLPKHDLERLGLTTDQQTGFEKFTLKKCTQIISLVMGSQPQNWFTLFYCQNGYRNAVDSKTLFFNRYN